MAIGQELRNAWRRLVARPAHTALATGILGLGLAAALFLFGGINSMVLSPLPFPHADRLVSLGFVSDERPSQMRPLNVSDWLLLRPHLTGFDAIAFDVGAATVNLSRAQEVTRYNGALIDAHLLPLLGVQPLLGRVFGSDDDRPGAPLTVLLGERVWRNDFQADPGVVGTSLRANGEAATIIGVLPADFAYPVDQEVWLPTRMSASSSFDVDVIARLAPDTTLAQARLALEALGQRMHDALDGSAQRGRALALQPLSFRFVNEVTRHMLWMLLATGLVVLVLACANVANLQLAQVLSRRRELAVRSALGAGRARLLRELLMESLVMAAAATMLAFALSHLGALWVQRSMIDSQHVLPYYLGYGFNARDVVFAAIAALATCLLAGLVPALRAAGTDVQAALRDGSKGSEGGGFARVARGLVVAEIALTVVLLVGAAMFIRGINGMLTFDLGTDTAPEKVLTGRIGLFPAGHPEPADQLRHFERAVAALQSDSQVQAASAATAIPGSAADGDDEVVVEGQARQAGNPVRAVHARVDPGFADVYGLRLREGRFLDQRDQADSLPVAVIDARLARALWPDRSPLGLRLRLNPDNTEAPSLTVVGVVDDLLLGELDDRRWPALLRPISQSPVRFATVAVRVRGDARAFAPRLAEILRSVDAEVPVYWLRTQHEAIRIGRAGPTLLTQMFSGAGLLALVLAAAGLYGVLNFSVAQRTREIGIRRAIGSSRAGVARVVGRRIAWQVALGIAIGAALALPWSAVLADPSLNTQAYDPLIFSLVIALIMAVAVAASLAPLRRALRVDPTVALRQD